MSLAAVSQILASLTLVALGAGAVLLAALAAPSRRARIGAMFVEQQDNALRLAWVASITAMGGSLYFSEVVGLVPCLWCWYQRIAMYPLVVVLGVGLLRSDRAVWRFALPLSLIGFVMSAYHALLQFRPELEIISCSEGVPCSGRYLGVFGFVSIPWMAGGAFLLISALMVALSQTERVTGESPLDGDDAP